MNPEQTAALNDLAEQDLVVYVLTGTGQTITGLDERITLAATTDPAPEQLDHLHIADPDPTGEDVARWVAAMNAPRQEQTPAP